ncbi:MAG: hypothetical protein OSB70_11020, partial [Myxococcota bacterium]|nr:hypothetical protein [Myxococcota bacterium]
MVVLTHCHRVLRRGPSFRLALPVAFMAFIVLLPFVSVRAAELVKFRVGAHKGYVRVVFELDEKASYKVKRAGSGNEVLVSFEASASPRTIRSPEPPVGEISVSSAGPGASQARIEINQPGVRMKEMVLLDPPRIVLDFRAPKKPAKKEAVAAAPIVAAPIAAALIAAPAQPSEQEPEPAASAWPVSGPGKTEGALAPLVESEAGAEILPPGAASLGIADSAADFDHFRTRFPLTGGHERVACENCHVAGLFEGTPTRCSTCHDGSGIRSDSGRSPSHIRSTNQCEDCHLQAAWIPSRIDHAAVLGSCVDCHNGVEAMGKSVGHPQSSSVCEDCHRSLTWAGAGFNHEGVTGICSTCHNGADATGKSPGHIVTTASCDTCHEAGVSWSVVRFDHSGITEPCANCHNGIQATGKPPGHVATTSPCDACHSAGTSWLNVQFDHSGVTGTCESCHNGADATGKPSGHIATTSACDTCHSAGTSWLNIDFDHSGVTGPCAS